ncbi:hypothetical protein SDC9_141355 [bioreactor metagenome]|uniref:Uncharacterized protein n=1 Tax=bioreactor metagenome TaxID=1076179 RepID=A0A645DXG7_9ZZZZ
MEAGVRVSGQAGYSQRDGSQAQQDQRLQQHEYCEQAHLGRFDLAPEEFRCAPGHQACQKHAQQEIGQELLQPAADTAPDGVDQHVADRDQAGQWRQRVVHGVDRAVGSLRRQRCPQRRGFGAEAHLLAFHQRDVLRCRGEPLGPDSESC